MTAVIIIIAIIVLFIVFIGMKHNEHIKEVEKLHKENKYGGFDGQVREWPIGSYYEKHNSFKFHDLYASKHTNEEIISLVAKGCIVQLQDGDDEEIHFLKRAGRVIDEPLGEIIGLYLKDDVLKNLYEGKLIEIKEKGYKYALW